jgi:HAMP domain-containing protein
MNTHLKSFLLGLTGLVAAYVLATVDSLRGTTLLGDYGPFVVSMTPVVVNFLRKQIEAWINGQNDQNPPPPPEPKTPDFSVVSNVGPMSLLALVLCGNSLNAADEVEKPKSVPMEAAVGAAETPQAEISGQQPSRAGEIVIWSSEESTGKPTSISWDVRPVLPGTTQAVAVDGGKRVILASFPGTYTVRLVVSNARGHSITERALVVSNGPPGPGPAPIPTPNPPQPKPDPSPNPGPPAEGEFGIAPVIFTAASRVASPNRAAEASKLADAAEAIAAQVSAGTMSKPQDIVNAIAAELKALPDSWDGVKEQSRSKLEGYWFSGKLKTVDRWAVLLREIAVGLRAVR